MKVDLLLARIQQPLARERFSERNAHLLAEFEMPPPTRVAAFEASIFESARSDRT